MTKGVRAGGVLGRQAASQDEGQVPLGTWLPLAEPCSLKAALPFALGWTGSSVASELRTLALDPHSSLACLPASFRSWSCRLTLPATGFSPHREIHAA